MLSGGVSYYRMLRPYFISAIFLALMSFYLGNFLIPKTNIKRREFKDKYMENLDQEKGRAEHEDQDLAHARQPGHVVPPEENGEKQDAGDDSDE